MSWSVSRELASGLLFPFRMKLEVRQEEPSDRDAQPDDGLQAIEVLEGSEEFLEALAMRLNEIILKPNGRFVISYISGKPGARTPPRVQ